MKKNEVIFKFHITSKKKLAKYSARVHKLLSDIAHDETLDVKMIINTKDKKK